MRSYHRAIKVYGGMNIFETQRLMDVSFRVPQVATSNVRVIQKTGLQSRSKRCAHLGIEIPLCHQYNLCFGRYTG